MSGRQSPSPETTKLRTIDIQSVSRPFFWVQSANLTLLWMATLMIFGVIAQALKSGSITVDELIPVVIIGFASWVAWRNVTVLNAVLQPLTLTSLLIVSTYGVFVSVIALPELFSADFYKQDKVEVVQTVSGVLMLSFVGLVAFAAAVSIFALRRKPFTALNINVVSLLRILKPLRSGRDGLSLPSRNSWLGWSFILAGSAILLGLDLIPDDIYFANNNALARMGSYIGSFAFALFVLGRAQFEPTANALLAVDSRPPVLFLRSFLDDEQISYQRSNRSLWDFSLEARLTEHFSGTGPFIAVGSPKDKTPTIGAARAHLADEEWQYTVLDWMDRSALIVVVAGVTGWINWELKKVIERGHTGKLIIIFPQLTNLRRIKDKALRRRSANAAARLTNVRQAFAGTNWQAGLNVIQDAQRTRAITFSPDGSTTVVEARSRNRNAYHLAALVAHYLMNSALRRPMIPAR